MEDEGRLVKSPPMRRRLLSILSAVSLVLCIAICTLWIWSRIRPGTYHALVGSEELAMYVSNGFIVYQGPPRKMTEWVFEGGQIPTTLSVMGLGHYFFACWKIAIACLALPLAWVAFFRRRQQPVGIVCRSCSYDLRATPNLCPECGMVPKAVFVQPRR